MIKDKILNGIIRILSNFIFEKRKRQKFRYRLSYRWGVLSINKDYQECFDGVFYKFKGLQNKAPEVRTLLLGDSHASCGLLPECFEDVSYNMGLIANDIYGNYEILKKSLAICPNLKRVIMLISYYNGGTWLIKGGDVWRCAVLHNIVGAEFDEKETAEDFQKLCHNFSKLKPSANFFTYMGFDFPGQKIGSTSPKLRNRVEHHYHLYHKYNNQWKVLEDMITYAKENNLEIVLVNSPFRDDYQKILDELSNSADTLKEIKEITNRHQIKFMNFNQNFEFEDFADADHLNFGGAVKLSKLIQNNL